ncbi:hypothetical protein HMN09_00476700 [Mycena chlorophos]|uniref:Uncharacterized protein n=1 Tax=Mycena chlorophos TaxID=658473 RepID=A0A8H6THP9_MYCCL|nr:hypothetical protein HMN09_00476700 [Mycena chlorophos]
MSSSRRRDTDERRSSRRNPPIELPRWRYTVEELQQMDAVGNPLAGYGAGEPIQHSPVVEPPSRTQSPLLPAAPRPRYIPLPPSATPRPMTPQTPSRPFMPAPSRSLTPRPTALPFIPPRLPSPSPAPNVVQPHAFLTPAFALSLDLDFSISCTALPTHIPTSLLRENATIPPRESVVLRICSPPSPVQLKHRIEVRSRFATSTGAPAPVSIADVLSGIQGLLW